MKSVPHRNYILLLYPDEDISHKNCLDVIKKYYDYAYIIHDKDIDNDNKLKKSHIHCLVSFPNARHLSAISKEFGITDNYIRVCNSFNNSLYYLIHYNEPTKHQYSIDEVFGPLKKKLIKLINNDKLDEDDVITYILDMIDNTFDYLTITSLNRYCLINGYWNYYRKSFGLILAHLNEHNNYFTGPINK